MEERSFTCSVCLEPIFYNNKVVLDCGHFFHRCCIYKIHTSNCPLCREQIKDINTRLGPENNYSLICCPSRCPLGYSPLFKDGECRYCYGKTIPDCV